MVHGTSHEILRTTSEPHQNHHATRYLIYTQGKLLHICHTLEDIQKKMGYPRIFSGHPQNLSLHSRHQQRNEGLNMLNCIVEIRNEFGNRRIYPVCSASRTLAKIAGTTTLTKETIDLAKELGYQFETLKEEV